MFKLKNRGGFTLIELIVVIAILGVLAAVLVPSIGSYVTKAKISVAESDGASALEASNRLIALYENDDDLDNDIDTTDKLVIALASEGIIAEAAEDGPIHEDANNMTIHLFIDDDIKTVVVWVKYASTGDDFYITSPAYMYESTIASDD